MHIINSDTPNDESKFTRKTTQLIYLHQIEIQNVKSKNNGRHKQAHNYIWGY